MALYSQFKDEAIDSAVLTHVIEALLTTSKASSQLGHMS